MNVYGAILCAGLGTRMRPLTEVLPKPLLPFLNTPIVAYALQLLAEANVERVALNLHHLSDTIPPVVDLLAPHLGVRPVYAHEWEILGTAGGIAGMWHALGAPEGILVVLNGDSVTDVELAPIIAKHVEEDADVTLVTRGKTDGQPGRVFLDADQKIVGIREFRAPGARIMSEVEFTGIHILNTRVLGALDLEFADIVDQVYGPLVAAGASIRAQMADAFWAALDTPQLLFDASMAVLKNPASFRLAPLDGRGDKLWIYGPESVDGSAQLAAPAFLGMNVVVENGSRIGPLVVADGATFKPGSRAANAILYGVGALEGDWENVVNVAGKVATIQGT